MKRLITFDRPSPFLFNYNYAVTLYMLAIHIFMGLLSGNRFGGLDWLSGLCMLDLDWDVWEHLLAVKARFGSVELRCLGRCFRG